MIQRDAALDKAIHGSFTRRFVTELFESTAHFPIAIAIYELLVDYDPGGGAAHGTLGWLLTGDPLILVLASVAQAYWLTRWARTPHPHRLLGNLIGPAIYTSYEVALEGEEFFEHLHHAAYWGISLAVGWLQGIRPYIRDVPRAVAIVAESVVRTCIVLIMYGAVQVAAEGAPRSPAELLAEPSHVFIAVTVPLLGLAIGLANLTADLSTQLLRATSLRLQTYSEWLLGPGLLRRSMADASALRLTREQRAVLFMDVRGFTAWSETQRPEAIVPVLELIYTTAERILDGHEPLKVKLSADEVMAVFARVDQALQAASELRTRIGPLLVREGMSVGIGIHAGDVVEGLMGAERTRVYDVIGDTVNTAKRIEQEAGPGEILVSATAREAAGPTFAMVESRSVEVKGKDRPLTLYRLRASRLAVDRT